MDEAADSATREDGDENEPGPTDNGGTSTDNTDSKYPLLVSLYHLNQASLFRFRYDQADVTNRMLHEAHQQ